MINLVRCISSLRVQCNDGIFKLKKKWFYNHYVIVPSDLKQLTAVQVMMNRLLPIMY